MVIKWYKTHQESMLKGGISYISMLVECEQREATLGLVEKDLLESMVRVWVKFSDQDPGKKILKVNWTVQCPNCSVVTDHETEQEAVDYQCPCSPQLPEMECFSED